jgi:hypothetical protein
MFTHKIKQRKLLNETEWNDIVGTTLHLSMLNNIVMVSIDSSKMDLFENTSDYAEYEIRSWINDNAGGLCYYDDSSVYFSSETDMVAFTMALDGQTIETHDIALNNSAEIRKAAAAMAVFNQYSQKFNTSAYDPNKWDDSGFNSTPPFWR